MRKFLPRIGPLLILLALSLPVLPQAPAIGQWRIHLPYRECISVAEAGSTIYAATPYNLFSYDKADQSLTRFTRVEGLSDVGVSAIAYHDALGILLIAYTNANLDLLTEDGIINISDIKRKPLYGNKTINNIFFQGNLAYLSCGFGIVVVDLDRKEIKDTYFIGPGGTGINVQQLCMLNGTFWAATSQGLLRASSGSPNLADFNSWKADSSLPCPTASYNAITAYDGKIITSISLPGFGLDTVYVYNGTNWNYLDSSVTVNVKNMNVSQGKLLLSYNYNIYIYGPGMVSEQIIWTYNPGTPEPLCALIDKENYLWIGDSKKGLIRNSGWDYLAFNPNGPGGNDVFSITSSGSDIWVSPGGAGSSWLNSWNQSGPYALIGGNWYTLKDQNPVMDTIFDIIAVAVDPSLSTHVFAASWKNGLLEFNNGILAEVYNENNSGLEIPYDFYHWIGIGGIDFDDNNNLWVVNSGCNALLKARTHAGSWVSFNMYPHVSQPRASTVLCDRNGNKWVLLTRYDGLLVFNENGTLTNKADDKVKVLTTSPGNGALPSNNVVSIAEDIDGKIWIGTDKGVAVFYSPEAIFTGSGFDAQVISIVQDSSVQHLLEFETVTAIAVDGANKKWIGTEKAGVFLMSADGTEEIHHFTEENSPLLSNTIMGITIDQNTGEVFFGTAKGVVSYRGAATEADETFSGVYAFPNPVREGFGGTIGIRGLARDAYVKITDISGNIVYETRAEGGQATWNARDFSGNKVKTGVYMVFCSSTDGSEKFATKILVIN